LYPPQDVPINTLALRLHHLSLAAVLRILRVDPPLTLAVYPCRPLEHELAVDLGSPAQKCVDPPGTDELARVPLPLEHRNLPRRTPVERHRGYGGREPRPRPSRPSPCEPRHGRVPL